MPHKRNPQLADDCITISAQIRALAPLALEGMLHDHEVDGAHSAMVDEALARACMLTGDLLTRLHIILDGLRLHEDRLGSNLRLTGGLISSEAVMLALGEAVGRQTAHQIVYELATATRQGVPFGEALAADPRVTSRLSADRIAALLDPRSHVGCSADLSRTAARRAHVLAEGLFALSPQPTPACPPVSNPLRRGAEDVGAAYQIDRQVTPER